MHLKLTYILISGLITLLASTTSKNNETIQLLTKQIQFEAGDTIELNFLTTSTKTPSLYISSSYGSTLVKANLESGILKYSIPQLISNKKGLVNWTLLSENKLCGKLNITANQKAKVLETYLGPPSIEAGGTDYAMLVVIPSDLYDNPLADSTLVTIKHQFLENQGNNTVFIKNGIAYKNIYSGKKSGRILASSECLAFNSKEYTINVMPAIPSNFKINYNRNHKFADGNQITTFSTSIIKDKHGNIVSDGTYVEFFITNTSNVILKTFGTTLHGIAKAKMIHPDHEDQWHVNAFIEGMAESNTITLKFLPIISHFNVLFSQNNRIITVGPLKSFMNQMVPDGLEVELSVYENNIKTQTLYKSSFEGFATFKLDTNKFPSKNYTFKIKTAGIEKTRTNVKL